MITFLLISMSKGIMNGIVFPDPVPAMTIASNPRIIASETSICQSYGSLPKRSWNNLAKSFWVLLLSYCVFFLADLHKFSRLRYERSCCWSRTSCHKLAAICEASNGRNKPKSQQDALHIYWIHVSKCDWCDWCRVTKVKCTRRSRAISAHKIKSPSSDYFWLPKTDPLSQKP